MSASYYYSFLTGGIGLLCVIGLAIAWLLWRENDARREAAASALEGVGHEFRINLERMAKELSGIFNGRITSAAGVLPVRHPQLDGVNSNLLKTNRDALATIVAAYDEIVVRKSEVRDALATGAPLDERMQEAVEATISGIGTLYLWDQHKGARPVEARSTRSWHVRDWMKSREFSAGLFPEMHLRDAVVEHLRQSGMVLTPKPLTHTAHEFYSMQYDRYADPSAPFGRRRKKAEDSEGEETKPGMLAGLTGAAAGLGGLFKKSEKADEVSEAEAADISEAEEISADVIDTVEEPEALPEASEASAPEPETEAAAEAPDTPEPETPELDEAPIEAAVEDEEDDQDSETETETVGVTASAPVPSSPPPGSDDDTDDEENDDSKPSLQG